jgi:hypothetical protein
MIQAIGAGNRVAGKAVLRQASRVRCSVSLPPRRSVAPDGGGGVTLGMRSSTWCIGWLWIHARPALTTR